jgi:hypothetical protein
VHLTDYQARLDQPGLMLEIPQVWYDYRNEKLKAAFKTLRQLVDTGNALDARKPIWKRWYGILLVLAIAYSFTRLVERADLISLLIVTTAALLLLVAWANRHIHKRRNMRARKQLIREIRQGKYGHAVMFDTDLIWDELRAALMGHRIVMNNLFRDEKLNKWITPIFATTLEDTWLERGMLRQVTPIPGKDHAALEQIRTTVAIAALRVGNMINGNNSNCH